MISPDTVQQIRAMLRSGMTRRAVAAALGLHENTVGKYQNDWMVARCQRRETERWIRIKTDPVVLERRRQRAKEWHNQKVAR